jgi:hypothetical protein
MTRKRDKFEEIGSSKCGMWAGLFDREQLGRLASLGIEKGKPFNPGRSA